MKNIIFLAWLLLGIVLTCEAQQSSGGTPANATSRKPMLPQGPLLKPAANFSQWEIVYTYADEQKKQSSATAAHTPTAAENARPRKTAVTKTGQVIHEVNIDILNRTIEAWFDAKAQYIKISSSATWMKADAGIAGSGYAPLPATGFRDMAIVEAGNYVGTVPYGNGTCLIFVPGGYDALKLDRPEDLAKRLPSLINCAYVDADSRMPVAVKTSSDTRVFHFNPAPTDMQTFPPDLTAQIKAGVERRAALERPAEQL